MEDIRMKRSLWTERLTKTSCPAWTCSICGEGFLSVLNNNTTSFLTADSNKKNHEFIVTAWAKCSNKNCEQKFAILGSGHNEKIYPDKQDSPSQLYYTLKACYPMPDIISIPANVPSSISDLLDDSYKLFLIDSNACGAKIRSSLEAFLDDRNIAKETLNKKGETHRIRLHDRISEYAKDNPDTGEHILAIKWLGNFCAHEDIDICKEDLLDAYEILEHTLNSIFDPPQQKVMQQAQKLTKKYAPTK